MKKNEDESKWKYLALAMMILVIGLLVALLCVIINRNVKI